MCAACGAAGGPFAIADGAKQFTCEKHKICWSGSAYGLFLNAKATSQTPHHILYVVEYWVVVAFTQHPGGSQVRLYGCHLEAAVLKRGAVRIRPKCSQLVAEELYFLQVASANIALILMNPL